MSGDSTEGLDEILSELGLTADMDEDSIDGMSDLGKLCLRAVGMLRHQYSLLSRLEAAATMPNSNNDWFCVGCETGDDASHGGGCVLIEVRKHLAGGNHDQR